MMAGIRIIGALLALSLLWSSSAQAAQPVAGGQKFMSLEGFMPSKGKNFRPLPGKRTFFPLARRSSGGGALKAKDAPVAKEKEFAALPAVALRPSALSSDEAAAVMALFPATEAEAEYSEVMPEKPRKARAERAVSHGWPVEREVRQRLTSGYGERSDPFTGEEAFHRGIDIAAPLGSDVLASAAGEVTETGRQRRLGKFVRLKHKDGSVSLYGHLDEIEVEEGAVVRKGEKIATIGLTGRTTGPHLDYSLWVDDAPVDPLSRLRMPTALKATAQVGSGG